jgi:catechol 2,3-dioxygenase
MVVHTTRLADPMTSETHHSQAPQSGAALPAATRLAAVDLTVTDLERSAAYYRDVVGLEPGARGESSVALAAGGEPLVVLHEEPSARPAGRHAGLFHFALLHPTREELAQAALRIATAREPLAGASDHGVSEALYLRDPDGNGIEIYADRPRSQWPPPSAPGDEIGMFTIPLDLQGLLGTIAGEELRPLSGPGLVMGHVHLQVGDIPRAEAFYGALGFEHMAKIPSASFMAAGGYHHHLGMNTWMGEGVGPAPAGTVGLRRWTIVVPAAADVAAAAARLREAGADVAEEGGGIVARDPWQIELLLRAENGA